MSKKHKGKHWRKNQADDPYFKQAQKEGYRSRAVYKLAEIDKKSHIFKHNMRAVDLGAAPGGWSQWAQKRLNGKIKLWALDVLPMDPLPDVEFILGDFTEERVLNELRTALNSQSLDLVMSDMAPNITGMKAVDQPRSMLLVELARDFAFEMLAKDGHFLCKVFQGEGFDELIRSLRPHFRQLLIRKPDASHSRSAEVYILGFGYK